MSVRESVAPRVERWIEVARPIPEAAPVMRIILSFKGREIVRDILRDEGRNGKGMWLREA